MNTTDTITEQELSRYHRLFDNHLYSAIANQIAAELGVERESCRTADAMNLVTDAALSLCHYPYYEPAGLKLVAFCERNAISALTIDAIDAYLLIFKQPGDTRTDDFERTAKALPEAQTVEIEEKPMSEQQNDPDAPREDEDPYRWDIEHGAYADDPDFDYYNDADDPDYDQDYEAGEWQPRSTLLRRLAEWLAFKRLAYMTRFRIWRHRAKASDEDYIPF